MKNYLLEEKDLTIESITKGIDEKGEMLFELEIEDGKGNIIRLKYKKGETLYILTDVEDINIETSLDDIYDKMNEYKEKLEEIENKYNIETI